MVISFSGNDGSGKTTIAKALLQRLQAMDIDAEYRHEYDYVFIKYLFRLLGDRVVRRERGKYVPRQDENLNDVAKRKLTLIQRAWPYVVWGDNLLTILYYKVFYRRKVIVLDRYPYDMYLSFEYLGRGNRFMRALFLLIPKADFRMIFYVPPHLAMGRKKDHLYSLEFYEIQLQRYLQLAQDRGIEIHNTNEALASSLSFVFTRLGQLSPPWLKHELLRNQ